MKSEFKNLPSGWRVVRLGDVLKIGSGKDYKHLKSGNIPVYGTGGYMLSVNDFLYDGESVCIGRKGTIDKPVYLNCKFWTVDTLFYTYGFKNSFPKFIYYVFLAIDWKKYNEASGVPSLSKNTVYGIAIRIPPLDEQEKIAEILSTWDEAINLTMNLIENKKQFKKALMQNLLAAKVRFPEFQDEWQEVKLGNLGKSYNGLIGKVAEDFQNGNSNFITYKNIFDNPKIDINIFEKVKIMEDEEQNLVKFGDIFFTTSSETPNEVGISSVLLRECGILYLNSFCFGFRLNNFEILTPCFAVFYFRSDCFRKQIFKLAQGSTRFNISKTEVLNLTIKLPNLNEQQKIAEVLTACDDEINLLNLKLENLKKQKQGLMQKLLSGKVIVG